MLCHLVSTVRSLKLVIAAAYVVGSVVLPGDSLSAAELAWSTPDFMAAKPQWGRLVGTPLRIEGRVASVGQKQFRLLKCDVPFVCPNEDLARAAGRTKALEVAGQLVRDEAGKRIEFRVASIEPIASDLERLRQRELAIRNPSSEQLLELADWAAERGDYFRDDDLLHYAEDTRFRVLKKERQDLGANDYEGRRQLAERVTVLRLPATLREELLFDAFLTQWKTVRDQLGTGSLEEFQTQTTALLEALAAQLPGAGTQQLGITDELRKQFQDDPLAAYVQADTVARRRLERLLDLEVFEVLTRSRVAPDGANALEIAASIQEVPEASPLVVELERQHLDYRLAGVERATQAEAQQLAADLRKAGLPERGRAALTRWVTARADRLRNDGAAGLVQAGDEALQILQSEQTAAELWIEALKVEADFPDARRRLEERGYAFEGGRWQKKADGATSSAPQPAALKAGLTRAQLRKLLGAPLSIQRVFTGKGTSEVWLYGQQGGGGLAIEFQRSSGASEPVIVTISGH